MYMKEYDYLVVGAGLFAAVFVRQAIDAGKRLDQRIFIHVHAVKHFHVDGILIVASNRHGAQNRQDDSCNIAKNVGGILGAEWANLELVFANRNVAHLHAFHFHIRFPPFSSSAPSYQQPAASTPDSGRSYRKRTGQAWKPMPWMP